MIHQMLLLGNVGTIGRRYSSVALEATTTTTTTKHTAISIRPRRSSSLLLLRPDSRCTTQVPLQTATTTTTTRTCNYYQENPVTTWNTTGHHYQRRISYLRRQRMASFSSSSSSSSSSPLPTTSTASTTTTATASNQGDTVISSTHQPINTEALNEHETKGDNILHATTKETNNHSDTDTETLIPGEGSSDRAGQLIERRSVTDETIEIVVQVPDRFIVPGTEQGHKKLAIVYTCTICNTRSMKQFTERAYNHGVVIIKCPTCQQQHLIADRIGYFSEAHDPEQPQRGFDLSTLAKRYGHSYQRVVVTPKDEHETTTLEDEHTTPAENLTLEDWIGSEKMNELIQTVQEHPNKQHHHEDDTTDGPNESRSDQTNHESKTNKSS